MVDATVTDLATGILDSLQDRVENEFNDLIEEVRGDNEELLKAVDWSTVDVEKIAQDPYMKDILVGLVQKVIDGLSYMNDD